VWARERSGYSIEDAAARLDKAADVLAAWERGESYPTYNQLEQLAEAVYHRPVALFFLPTPPDEAPIQRQFRTLPDTEVSTLEPDTRYALRDALAFQESLRELTGGRNPAPRLIISDFHPTVADDTQQLATRVRTYLGVSFETQTRWTNAEAAMATWRAAVESVGVFVFKRSFRQRTVSGFCVHDSAFPVIVVNNSTPFTRQVFTLFHELAHLLYGLSSITKDDPDFIEHFAPADRTVEVACNRFAADFLVPAEAIRWTDFNETRLEQFVSDTAARLSVSREVILRRLLDRGLITSNTYAEYVREWNTEPARDGGGEGGGNYYATQAAYLSRAFLGLAFAQYRAGRIGIADLSEHLRMRARNVSKLEDFLLAKR
jgi:Zn-dependent peptidase ImmA (M78 family)/transcriptional regulator with XRE-family HTH domain